MSKLGVLGMIEKESGFTIFYDIKDIHHIYFIDAIYFYDENDVFANGYEPDTTLIVIHFNDGIVYTFDSAKYQIYFE